MFVRSEEAAVAVSNCERSLAWRPDGGPLSFECFSDDAAVDQGRQFLT
jgi:hypothetical protein